MNDSKKEKSILDLLCDGIRAHCVIGQPITDDALCRAAMRGFPRFARMAGTAAGDAAIADVAKQLRGELGDNLAADWEAQFRAPKPHLMPRG